MDRKHNHSLLGTAKALRKNMTKEEKHLWFDFLRTYPIKITRQKILGKYIVDFYCASANLVIELDGSQHFDDVGMKHDNKRTQYLKEYGLTVIRIPNNEINNNFDNVCIYLDNTIKQSINKAI